MVAVSFCLFEIYGNDQTTKTMWT